MSTKSKKGFVVVSAAFIRKVRELTGGWSKAATKERLGVSKSTIMSWDRSLENGEVQGRVSSVAKIVASELFSSVCTVEATGLSGLSCDTVKRFIGGAALDASPLSLQCASCEGKALLDTVVFESKMAYQATTSLEELLEREPIYEKAIGATRLWVDSIISEEIFVEGVDYSLGHTDRVLRNLNVLIRPFETRTSVTSCDAFVLVLTALLHDLGYYLLRAGLDADKVATNLGVHPNKMGETISSFSKRLPVELADCISKACGDEESLKEQVTKAIIDVSPHVEMFVRFHNVDQIFQVQEVLRNVKSDWDCHPDKVLALLAIFQLADALDFHFERADLLLREKLNASSFGDLSVQEQTSLTRLSMHTAFAPPTLDWREGEITISIHPRFDGPKKIGNTFLAICDSKVNSKINKEHNPMLSYLEKFLAVNISAASDPQPGSGFEIGVSLAYEMARTIGVGEPAAFALPRATSPDAGDSIEDAFSKMLRIAGGHISWVKKCHPRGFLYGGTCAAHLDLRQGIPVVERCFFNPKHLESGLR
jgi:hypothetical protein